MSKFTPNTFTNLNNETSFINQLNANFSTLQTLLDTMVSRDGTTPNTMTADFDVNSQDVLNVNNAYVQTLFINGSEVVPTDLANVPATEIPVGTVGAPGLAVDGDADTGFFQDTLNTLAISIGGSEVFRAKSTGIDVVGDVVCTDDITCDNINATSMTITTGGLVISAGGINVTGTVTLPSHTLANGTTATTQSASDNSTKVATTAYVDTAVAAVGGTTYDKLGAYQDAATNQSIASGGIGVTVALDTEYFDTGADFNTGTYKWTAPANAYYMVSARVLFQADAWSADKKMKCWIYRSDVSIPIESAEWISWASVTTEASASLSGVVYCTAGQTLELVVYHNRGSGCTVDEADLFIARLP